MLNALAYVPPESVIIAFEDLLQTYFYKEHEIILAFVNIRFVIFLMGFHYTHSIRNEFPRFFHFYSFFE